MKLVEFITTDGEVWVEESHVDKVKGYNHTFKAVDDTTPFPLYGGYKHVSSSLTIPGVPIVAHFQKVDDWSVYQPSTYTMSNASDYTPVEVRGTLGLGSASAYHVVEVGVFKGDSQYETPNTPCVVKKLDGSPLGTTLVTNEPARYLGSDTFYLTGDISFFGNDAKVNTDVLMFVNGVPKVVQAQVLGIASATYQDSSVFTPLSLDPPDTAFFTGSTSGTLTLRFVRELQHVKYGLTFGSKQLFLVFRRGWIFNSALKPGDSGGPLFRTVPPRETDLP